MSVLLRDSCCQHLRFEPAGIYVSHNCDDLAHNYEALQEVLDILQHLATPVLS